MRWIIDKKLDRRYAAVWYRVRRGIVSFEDSDGKKHNLAISRVSIGGRVEEPKVEEPAPVEVPVVQVEPASAPEPTPEPEPEPAPTTPAPAPKAPAPSDTTWRNSTYELSKVPRASARTFYRARFEVRANDAEDVEVWPQVVGVLQEWLEAKEEARGDDSLYNAITDDVEVFSERFKKTNKRCYVSKRFALGTFLEESGNSYLRTKAVGIGEKSVTPRFWAMEYVERDANHGYRFWITDIGITLLSMGVYAINIRVRYLDDPTYVYEVWEPKRNTPRFVRELLDISGCSVYSGGTRLTGYTKLISAKNFKAFMRELESPKRQVPLVVIASTETADGSESYLIDPRELAKRLRGAAVVYRINRNDPELEQLYAQVFDNPVLPAFKFRIVPGALRVYWNGVNLTNPGEYDYARHRFFTPEALQSPEDVDRIVQNISDGISRLLIQQSGEVLGIADLEQQARRIETERLRNGREFAEKRLRESEARRTEVEESLKEAGDWKALAEEFANELTAEREVAESLKAENESLRKENTQGAPNADVEEYFNAALAAQSEAESLREQLESVEDKNAELEHYNRQLREQSDRLRAAGGIQKKHAELLLEMGSYIADTTAAITLAKQAFDDRLVILDEAVASAVDYDGDASEMFEALKAMYFDLWDMRYGPTGSESVGEDAFKARTGFGLAFHERKLTQRDSKLMKLRERQYKGKTVMVTPHVKGKGGNHSKLRVHFCFDVEDQLIVVGHCGNHMTTSGTSRM